MPCNYKRDYPSNWKTEIRPAIIARSGNRCEVCGVPNGMLILRGCWCDREVYQDEDGWIYDAETSDKIGGDYCGEVDETGKRMVIKVVCTVADLDHDTNNNEMDNLKFMCQMHHIRHDREQHMESSRKKRLQKSGAMLLFEI